MCSIGEEDFGDEGGLHTMEKDLAPELNLLNKLCVKCNSQPAVVIHDTHAKCSQCFQFNVGHKFYSAIGASKQVVPSSEIVIVFDGSARSVSMLSLILDDERKTKRWLQKILYVDKSVLLSPDTNTRIEYLESVKALIPSTPALPCFYTSICNNFIVQFNEVTTEYLDTNKNSDLQFLLNWNSRGKSITNQQEHLNILYRKTIASAVNDLKCSFVFLPEIKTDIASRMLINTVLGLGCYAGKESSFIDDRYNIKSMKPMRNITQYEVDQLVTLKNLKYIQPFEYGRCLSETASLHNAVENFTSKLQKEYTATISTLFSVGSKLNEVDLESTSHCLMCNAVILEEQSDTNDALEYSKFVSKAPSNYENVTKRESSSYTYCLSCRKYMIE